MKKILLAVLSLLLRASKAGEPHAIEENLLAEYAQEERNLQQIDEYAQELIQPEHHTCMDDKLSQLSKLDQ